MDICNLMKKINQNREKAAQNTQDEIFRKMTVEKKLSLLNEFFRAGRDLQKLNDRRRRIIKIH